MKMKAKINPSAELLQVKADLALNCSIHLIRENEVLDLLENEFPLINSELKSTSNSVDVYKSIRCFAEFTKTLIFNNNFTEVKHCFNVAEKMLQQGNNTVKNAIENVYVYSMSSILDMATPLSKKTKEIMNDSLRREYNRQICSHGI
jgi:hypothetical protein